MSLKLACAIFLLGMVACAAPPSSDSTAPAETPTAFAKTSTPTAEPSATLSPLPTLVYEQYVIRNGDTLIGIAQRFDITVDDLAKLNGISNANSLQIGQILRIPVIVPRAAPADRILPDSELVYSSAYQNFDVSAVANQYNGYLASYRQSVEGENLTGPQIVQLVAERYSVGPRVLLTLLESQSGWLTKTSLTQNQVTYPMGLIDSTRQGLFFQTSWAANRLNEGYYGKLSGQLSIFRFRDRARARIAPAINPGSAAIQNIFSQFTTIDAWQPALSGFSTTYKTLFGDPNSYAIDPLVPRDLSQPTLRLPWSDGAMWYFTGGPHSGWGDASGWAAVDFTPRDVAGSCWPSGEWVIASAPGKVIRSEHARVMQSLGNSNFQGSGWVLMYMHIANVGRVKEGTLLNTSDRIGHPSCEGGNADASHTHFARLYNGVWISTNDVPFMLSGWRLFTGDQEYDGKMTRGNETREACNCKDESKNTIVADSGR
jgi:LasA protease